MKLSCRFTQTDYTNSFFVHLTSKHKIKWCPKEHKFKLEKQINEKKEI